jgi:hypothetical protein
MYYLIYFVRTKGAIFIRNIIGIIADRANLQNPNLQNLLAGFHVSALGHKDLTKILAGFLKSRK